MRIAIITGSSEIHSTQRLAQVAASRGHDVSIIPILSSGIALSAGAWEVVAGKVSIRDIDAVIPRITADHPLQGLSVLRQLELAGCYSLNNSASIEVCQDKFRTLALLNQAGIAIPRTALVKDIEQVRWAIEHAGGSPVILKPLAGSKGEGVVRGDGDEGARSMMEALLLLDQEVLVQEYIGEASGRHMSILICGDEVVCAVRQEAPAGRFRSNLLQGGQGTAFTPNRALSELARQAARCVDLEVAGIDILESNRGPLVIEVNASTGLGGIEKATGIDIAERLIVHLEERSRRPNLPHEAGAGGARTLAIDSR